MLTRPISPPVSKRRKLSSSSNEFPVKKHRKEPVMLERGGLGVNNLGDVSENLAQFHSISSPIQLTQVEGLSSSNNIDTVSLKDIIGDPLIKECWMFNYLFDIDFLM